MSVERIRNVAIIAHVDHGKTTLVDQLLYQSGMFRAASWTGWRAANNLIMDSNPLERERGITILSKNCAIQYTDAAGRGVQDQHHRHARPRRLRRRGRARAEDGRRGAAAGGRLRRADAADAVRADQGPGARAEADRGDQQGGPAGRPAHRGGQRGVRPAGELEANNQALDFPVLYASARQGWASRDLANPGTTMEPVFDAIIKHVPPPRAEPDKPLQMLMTTLDYTDYVGRIAIGRVFAGVVNNGQKVTVIDRDGTHTLQKITQLYLFEGLGKKGSSRPRREISARSWGWTRWTSATRSPVRRTRPPCR